MEEDFSATVLQANCFVQMVNYCSMAVEPLHSKDDVHSGKWEEEEGNVSLVLPIDFNGSGPCFEGNGDSQTILKSNRGGAIQQ